MNTKIRLINEWAQFDQSIVDAAHLVYCMPIMSLDSLLQTTT